MKTISARIFISTFLFASFQIPAKAQAVNVQDSLALVDLYNSTEGTGWYHVENWLTSSPVSTWYGIKVENNRVKNIALTGNNLRSKIPASIGKLSSLTNLDLYYNRLTGVPAEIGNLSSLSLLNLSNNQLTSIPAEIGNLSSLTTLNLYYNKLTSLPAEIGKLAKLTELELWSNQLTSVPPEIGNLSGLNILNLGGNQLTSVPTQIGKLAKLTELELWTNQLTSLPSEIGNLSNLSYLSLGYNQLTSVPSEFGKLANLNKLYLEYNQLTSVPAEIGNLSILNELRLNNNQLASVPASIGNLSGLTSLGLNDNQLTSVPASIGNLSNLTELWLYNNQLTSVPASIGSLSNLASLNLSKNQLTSLPAEIGNLSKLTILDLGGNQLTTIPAEIGKMGKLKELYLRNNQLAHLPVEIDNLVNLKKLFLFNNRLNFGPLEMVEQKFPFADYVPQANISLHYNNSGLSVSAGGTLSNNTYNWYKVEDGTNTTIVGDSVFHPSLIGKYYATVTNNICKFLTLYTDTIYYDAVLPVTLININAQQLGGMVKVDWTSVTEINVNRYEIQRAADAQNFTGIGSLPATGNGTLSINYSFNDVKPLQGNNYYRLKAFDKDGAITYSNMVLVKMNSDKTTTLIYPNPVKNILNIQLNGSASFSLMNQSGRVMCTKTISNSGVIDMSHYAAGLYYLKNNSTSKVQKIIVAK